MVGRTLTASARVALVFLLVSGTVAGQLKNARTASAAVETELASFGSLLVDDAHQRVLVSPGVSGSELLVTDFTGEVISRVPGLYGATGMAQSADGRSIYVALSGGDAIAVLDAEALAVERLLNTPSGTCPTWLAVAGGRLWTGAGCRGQEGMLLSVDPKATDRSWERTAGRVPGYYAAPYLASAGPSSSYLAVGELGLSPGAVEVYSIVDGRLELRASTAEGSNLGQVAFAAGTHHLAIAWGAPYYVPRFTVSAMRRAGDFTTGPYPAAVTFARDGKQLIVGTFYQDKPILVFDVGSTTPRFRTGSGFVPQRGVAANRDGTRLFYVASPSIGGPLTLRIATAPKG